MKILQIISEHKKIKKDSPVKRGFKRVMAIVQLSEGRVTRHLDVAK